MTSLIQVILLLRLETISKWPTTLPREWAWSLCTAKDYIRRVDSKTRCTCTCYLSREKCFVMSTFTSLSLLTSNNFSLFVRIRDSQLSERLRARFTEREVTTEQASATSSCLAFPRLTKSQSLRLRDATADSSSSVYQRVSRALVTLNYYNLRWME